MNKQQKIYEEMGQVEKNKKKEKKKKKEEDLKTYVEMRADIKIETFINPKNAFLDFLSPILLQIKE